jgi:hypothetical protein
MEVNEKKLLRYNSVNLAPTQLDTYRFTRQYLQWAVFMGKFLLLLLYAGYTTNQMNIAFRYLLQLPVQRCQGHFLFFFFFFFSYYQGCWRMGKLWIISFHSWKSWWSGRQGVRRYHNSQCRGILGELPDLRLFSSTAKVSALGLMEFYCTWKL